MSSHPYRQRIPQGNTSPSSEQDSYQPEQDHLQEHLFQYHSQPLTPPVNRSRATSPEAPYPITDPAMNASNNLTSNLRQLNLNSGSSHTLPLHEQNQFNTGLFRQENPTYSNVQGLHAITNTPPPVFNGNVTSPPSNPLSATSSVTNFNLNNPTHFDPNSSFSKSENNLAISATKFNHNRSISSTSSFFDKGDNISLVDFNQNLITQYLGDNSSHLLPRIKTIELYRKNAKRSNDLTVLFQYAQYMLQTALLLDKERDLAHSQDRLNTPSVENSPLQGPSKSKSNASIDLSNLSDANLDDDKLRKSLLKEATIYLKKLSDKGYVDAQYLLGDAYSSGALGKIENKEAFVLFQSSAKHGHVESAYRTSYCYEEGLGTGRDARKAIEYLKMAASKNHPAAMYKLGVYSFYGRMGLSKTDINIKKMGIKWLTRASNVATELIAAAPYELGKIYFDGFKDIVIQDKKYALELYSQAAALGHIESSALLGHYYEIGEVVSQDSNLSIHYYTQAALGGDPNSMLSMCAWYLVGNEPYLPKDESESFEWAKRAALCDLPKAQFALANFYDKGIGCDKNSVEAQNWYVKAAENGDEKAISRITNKELASKLQRKLKKKKAPSSGPNRAVTSNLDFETSKSTEKDCVIV